MNRDGFLLGLIATGSQVLILRELISSLQGNELFVGTALCGWLLWGALGAWLGNRSSVHPSPQRLLAIASLLLPASIIDTRLAPLIVTSSVGEPVSFVHASLLTLLLVAPCALVCGWLFPAIARRDRGESPTLRVYFAEGVGAFAACVPISILTMFGVSSLTMATILAAVVLLAVVWTSRVSTARRFRYTIMLFVLVGASPLVVPLLDHHLDRIRLSPYDLLSSWDTPYSHQTLIRRGEARVLLTDYTVEAVEGDLQSAENLLLPAGAYSLGYKVLVLGQLDLTLRSLVTSMPGLMVTEVDPRSPLGNLTDPFCVPPPNYVYVQQDPVEYIRSLPPGSTDIVILPLGESGSYRLLRSITPPSLIQLRRVLKPGGVLQVVAPYDTERYVTPGAARILATIRANLAIAFPHTIVWPGTTTLFLAGDTTLSEMSVEYLATRMPHSSQFMTEGYLSDRLNPWNRERLETAMAIAVPPHTLERPTLALQQIASRSQVHTADRRLARLTTNRIFWLAPLALTVLVIALLGISGYRRRSPRLLFFSAGFVSLTLELLSFYVYQSSVGLLYSQLSLLIGSFMLGLAVGTRLAMATRSHRLPIVTLALLGLLTLTFLISAAAVPTGLALIYHALFQFGVAASTGALFVAASRLTTVPDSRGYALELAGSALASLIVLPVLLPTLGLNGALVVVALILGANVAYQTAIRRSPTCSSPSPSP